MGVLNIVAPGAVRFTTGENITLNLIEKGHAFFATQRLRFIPEPSLLLGLGAGVVLLGVLSRRRRRR